MTLGRLTEAAAALIRCCELRTSAHLDDSEAAHLSTLLTEFHEAPTPPTPDSTRLRTEIAAYRDALGSV